MQVTVSGQHISIGNSLQEYVESRTHEIVGKYFENAPSTDVHFSKQGHNFTCNIIVRDGTGRHVVIRINNMSDDIYNAFDLTISKLEKQLRRYKSKLNNHHKRVKLSEAVPDSVKYIISPATAEEDQQEFNVDNPTIVAEKPTAILSLSVGEAVMRMDLEDLPALMFKNIKTNRVNVVYYRKDGNISWVDSQ